MKMIQDISNHIEWSLNISVDVSDGVDHACVVKHVKDADGHIYILDMKHFEINESQKMIMKKS